MVEEADSAPTPVFPLEIVQLGINQDENRTAHHTDKYDYPGLIVRRGQPFQLTLTAAKPLPSR